MNDKQFFILGHDLARRRAVAAVAQAPADWRVTVEPPRRSNAANAALWPILEAFSRQLQWPVNGVLQTLSADEWKDILSSAFLRESVRVAPGLDGGMVMLGLRTSKMSKAVFSEFIEFLHATAAARGVRVYDEETA